MKKIRILSRDGVHKIFVAVWEPQVKPIGIVQISHGMQEYILRYDEFAKFLCSKGFVVIGNDHLGHGRTVNNQDELGYMCDKDAGAVLVHDLHRVTMYAKKKYPGIPVFLLGHSMGSFLARRYMMMYGKEIKGAILVGTGDKKKSVIFTGMIICALLGKIKGEKYRSPFVELCSFGAYNRRIKKAKYHDEWIAANEEVLEKRRNDELCMFRFTVNGFFCILNTLRYIQSETNIKKIPKQLPVLMLSGQEDPVGDYTKGVLRVYDSLVVRGMYDIVIKLYTDMRHEVLNEKKRYMVYEDIYKWICKRMD